MGIKILPPNINKSRSGFTVSDGDIRFGLAVIKNVGTGVIDAVVAEREKRGEFTDYNDFVKRTAGLSITKRVHEFLIKAGAFDALGETRAGLLTDYESRLDAAIADRKKNLDGQVSFFGAADPIEAEAPATSSVPEFPAKRLLALEKESVGFYLTGHPLDSYAAEVAAASDCSLMELMETGEGESRFADGTNLTLCGIVTYVREKITKSNQMMAFVTIEDMTGSIECLVFPKIYAQLKPCLYEDNAIAVYGRLSMKEEEEPKLIVNDAEFLTDAAKKEAPKKESAPARQETARGNHAPTQKLYLKFCLGKDFLLDRIKPLLAEHSGAVPVCIHIEETKTTVMAPQALWVTPDETLLGTLTELLGQENVVLK